MIRMSVGTRQRGRGDSTKYCVKQKTRDVLEVERAPTIRRMRNESGKRKGKCGEEKWGEGRSVYWQDEREIVERNSPRDDGNSVRKLESVRRKTHDAHLQID